MKKLSQVSPFILLLLPMMAMMAFGLFYFGNSAANNSELVKTTAPTPLIKAAVGIIK